MKRFFFCFLILAGCAAPVKVREGKSGPASDVPSAPAHPWRQMIVYVPQTEDAAGWLKWFVKYPNLRMVIAMSPRFQHAAKDPLIKAQMQALFKAGRLEFALQIPNAPILPLLVDSSSAKEGLPPGTELPSPAYAYPDDIIQLIAQSKASFFKQWNFLPHGLVLPYGAASPKLISLLERLGFTWIVGALEAPSADGPYQSGAAMIWDGTPSGKDMGTRVRVWDERQTKVRPLEGWVAEMLAKKGMFFLPQEAGVAPLPLGMAGTWKLRTWMEPNVSQWIGDASKNAAWNALRKTREALETYKNSGQASVQRLDVAFDQIYSAQNSNYFSSIGNTVISPALAEEREHEFQATLLAVYRMIGQAPPEDLFKSTETGLPTAARVSSTTARAESFPDGREHVLIEDALNDPLSPGSSDLKSLEVWATTISVNWIVTLATMTPTRIDVYVDINGQPNAGTSSFLPGRPYVTSAVDAWEYAIAFDGPAATLYRTQGTGTYGAVQTFPITVVGNSFHITMPRDVMRGSPRKWGYQVLVMTNTTLSDFIDPFEISQKDLWQELSTNKRSDIPFVRVRTAR